MPATYTFPLFAIFVSVILIFPSSSSLREKRDNLAGFSTIIVNRDSVISPLYDPNLTYSERVDAAVERSFTRYHYLQSTLSKPTSVGDFQTWKWPFDGEYIVAYVIGTPPFPTYSILDTGSSLSWLQCLPCQSCYDQFLVPIFEPAKSSSYIALNCDDDRCDEVPNGGCDNKEVCAYKIKYFDSSYTEGDIGLETLTFRDDNYTNATISLPKMIIGCGRKNQLLIRGVPGILGINRSPSSFLSQQGFRKFSYCMTHPDSTEKSLIRFGSKALIQGITTPLLRSPKNWDTYFLQLEGISVDDKRLPIPVGTFNITKSGDGGMMIDSGTTFSIIKKEAFDIMINEVKEKMKDYVVEKNNQTSKYAACYWDPTSLEIPPVITFHFSGADLKLDRESTWIYKPGGTFCFAMFSATNRTLSIFGNRQQMNLNVGYDLPREIVSFDHKGCMKQ